MVYNWNLVSLRKLITICFRWSYPHLNLRSYWLRSRGYCTFISFSCLYSVPQTHKLSHIISHSGLPLPFLYYTLACYTYIFTIPQDLDKVPTYLEPTVPAFILFRQDEKGARGYLWILMCYVPDKAKVLLVSLFFCTFHIFFFFAHSTFCALIGYTVCFTFFSRLSSLYFLNFLKHEWAVMPRSPPPLL